MSNKNNNNMGFIFGKDFNVNRIPDFDPEDGNENKDAGAENEGASDDAIMDDSDPNYIYVDITVSLFHDMLEEVINRSKKTGISVSRLIEGYVMRGEVIEEAKESGNYTALEKYWGLTKYKEGD